MPSISSVRQRAVVVLHARLDALGVAGAVDALEELAEDAVAVLGVEERERVGAEERGNAAPEEALGGGVRVRQACPRRRRRRRCRARSAASPGAGPRCGGGGRRRPRGPGACRRSWIQSIAAVRNVPSATPNATASTASDPIPVGSSAAPRPDLRAFGLDAHGAGLRPRRRRGPGRRRPGRAAGPPRPPPRGGVPRPPRPDRSRRRSMSAVADLGPHPVAGLGGTAALEVAGGDERAAVVLDRRPDVVDATGRAAPSTSGPRAPSLRRERVRLRADEVQRVRRSRRRSPWPRTRGRRRPS